MSAAKIYTFLREAARVYSVASLFNVEYAAPDSDVLPSDVAIDRDGILRVAFASSASGVLRAKLTRGGATVVVDYNAGAPLAANALYAFDLPVKKGDYFNLRYSAAGRVLYCEVQLLAMPI